MYRDRSDPSASRSLPMNASRLLRARDKFPLCGVVLERDDTGTRRQSLLTQARGLLQDAVLPGHDGDEVGALA
ncbi:hypothetical protein GCM10020218_035050 [Dactylosporangium vinaceum]